MFLEHLKLVQAVLTKALSRSNLKFYKTPSDSLQAVKLDAAMIEHTRTARTRTVTYLPTRIFTEPMKRRAFAATGINASKYL